MIEEPSTARPAGVAGSAKVGDGEIRLQRFGGCVIVRLAGEFGASNASSLQRSLCDLVNADHVVVELSRVAFLDATALHALTHAHNAATKCWTSVQIAGARGTVRRLLEVTGSDANLNYHDHTVDAVEAALAARDAIRPGR